MLAKIAEFKVSDGYRLEVLFEDGARGVADLSDLVGHGIFEPLRDRAYLAQASLDEFGVICWPNGADLAPDAMRAAFERKAVWRPKLAHAALPA